MKKQKLLYESGNELAAYAAKQINYHVMGYYPITPSTQIAENLDTMKADGLHDITLIAAEGEHSAAGVCYGASTAGARVFNATSANGLLYALEQFPVQSGTRFPMVMNVACRTVSGPLCIKGDHSDIMYMLNTGWIILFAHSPQMVYDLNILGLKLAEKVNLPVVIAFDGFFTSHQKQKCMVFENDETVQEFLGKKEPAYSLLNLKAPVTIGSYMNEPDVMNNRYQLHLAMRDAASYLPALFSEYEKLSGRKYGMIEGYRNDDAEVMLVMLGSSYHTAKDAVDKLREIEDLRIGIVTLTSLRPFPKTLINFFPAARTIIILDRQDSYGAEGGNLSLEVRADFYRKIHARILTRVYGLGGKDLFVDDVLAIVKESMHPRAPQFSYHGITEGIVGEKQPEYFAPLTEEEQSPGITVCNYDGKSRKMIVTGGRLADTTAMPMRIAPGHGACPGCGIPVNLNLLLKGIEGNVVVLFQTGCGMIITTGYPKTAFRIPYIHNLFQNGAATLSGVEAAFHELKRRGEYPDGDITFLMVSGDGGMDIGMGSALGTALRNQRVIIFEYDNGGYMNTGYQLSYSTPLGARSSTSHLGKAQYGKTFFHKDTPEIMAATHIPYVATVAESNPTDFIKKAAKAAAYSRDFGTAYLKALSACPLNWSDKPNLERSVISAAVDCCYFPLYEIEQGITTLSYDPSARGKKIPVVEWLAMMGRTKHLVKDEYSDIVTDIQAEVDRRFERLKARADNPLL